MNPASLANDRRSMSNDSKTLLLDSKSNSDFNSSCQ